MSNFGLRGIDYDALDKAIVSLSLSIYHIHTVQFSKF